MAAFQQAGRWAAINQSSGSCWSQNWILKIFVQRTKMVWRIRNRSLHRYGKLVKLKPGCLMTFWAKQQRKTLVEETLLNLFNNLHDIRYDISRSWKHCGVRQECSFDGDASLSQSVMKKNRNIVLGRWQNCAVNAKTFPICLLLESETLKFHSETEQVDKDIFTFFTQERRQKLLSLLWTEGLRPKAGSAGQQHSPVGRCPASASWRNEHQSDWHARAGSVFCPKTAVAQQCATPPSGVC